MDFINQGSTTPTRKEYSDYLSYVAQYVQDQGIKVAYGEDVIAIEEVSEGTVQVFSRLLATGETIIRRTSQCSMHCDIAMHILTNNCLENLIISPGGSPWCPRSIQALLPNPRIPHTSKYLFSVEPMLAVTEAATRSLRVAIVGAGQSAVEVLLDLHSRLASMGESGGQRHDIHLIIRGGSLKPSDAGPFVNEIYSPECKLSLASPEQTRLTDIFDIFLATDTIYNMPSDTTRKRVLADYHNTNYGSVNPRTLNSVSKIPFSFRS